MVPYVGRSLLTGHHLHAPISVQVTYRHHPGYEARCGLGPAGLDGDGEDGSSTQQKERDEK